MCLCAHAHLHRGSHEEELMWNCVFSPVKRKRTLLVGGGGGVLSSPQRKPQSELLSPKLPDRGGQPEAFEPSLHLRGCRDTDTEEKHEVPLRNLGTSLQRKTK